MRLAVHWVTRSGVHLDRVASPWLIKRFLDPGGRLGFIEEGEEVPAGAVGYALPGSAFPPHDDAGSAFRKLLTTIDRPDPSLDVLADAVDVGICISLRQPVPDNVAAPTRSLGEVLAGLSEGMAVLHLDDLENLRRSFPVYDALYVWLLGTHGAVGEAFPSAGPLDRIRGLRLAGDWGRVFPPPEEVLPR